MPVNVSAVAHIESYTPCRPTIHIPAGAAPYTMFDNKSFIPCRSLDLEIVPVSNPVVPGTELLGPGRAGALGHLLCSK